MIKFFRRIRYDLIENSKTTKYFKYALGEIALVVIGILIALSINNWNENRKLKNQEAIAIQNLHTDLTMNFSSIKTVIIENSNTIDVYEKLRSVVEENRPYSKDLDSLFGLIPHWESPMVYSSTYNSLQSNSLSLISNDTLKNQIIQIYDVELPSLINDLDKYEWGLNQNVVNPFFSKNFMYDDRVSLYNAVPNDFEILKKNPEFLNILSIIIRQRKKGIERYKGTLIELNKLIQNIENVLD